MLRDSLKPATELLPVRQCPVCRHKWPWDWEYCRNCVVWLPGHETTERITRLLPCAPFTAAPVVGRVFLACEVRLGSEYPDDHQMVRARSLLEGVLTDIESGAGAWSFTPGRGVLAQWSTAERGVEAAALVTLKAGQSAAARVPPAQSLPSLQLGVAVVGKEAKSPQEASRQAIRLAALAAPNTALFAQSAYEMLVERFDFVGVQPVIARSESLQPVFRLLHRKPERSGTHQVGPEMIPMVGRRDLLDTLNHCANEVAGGQSIAVHVIGEPGLGKSKLIREWLCALEAAGNPGRWLKLVCHGVPYGGYPLRAWQLLFGQDAGPGGVDHFVRVAAVAGRLQHRGRPALIVVDDLHWIDAESRALIEQLMARDCGVPMMAVLAYRPSFLPHAPANPPQAHRRLRLTGLRHDELAALLDLLSKKIGIEVPAPLEHQILQHAAGSPLYVEQAIALIAAMARHGAEQPEFPPSLLDLLILRIRWVLDRTLPELRRRQREWLSGFLGGNRCDPDLVRALENLEEQLGSWLDRLDVVDDGHSTDDVRSLVCGLAKVDQELGLLNLLVGRQRPHRGRMAQALERIARLNRVNVGLE